RQSKNSVSVYLMKELGNVDIVRDFVDKLGIDKNDIPRQPSICLGSADLSVMQMTGAYSVFSNKGVYNKPVFVTRIEDKNGKVIYNYIPEQHKAFPENYNYVMVNMLKYAAKIIQPGLKTEVGGKTGTTNDYRDGWFMGITPDLVVGTWVGGDEQWIKFRSITYGQGAYMARPTFVNFIKYLENSKNADYDPNVKFEEPIGGTGVELDCDKYKSFENDIQPQDDEFDEDI
ncbi:MAG TPA: peptidoglycan glycosyltransferase, partial [Bacteroidetes bacterium]|nr:peptidoglycan glycosyltransferase [Bacteroidota bacterium]